MLWRGHHVQCQGHPKLPWMVVCFCTWGHTAHIWKAHGAWWTLTQMSKIACVLLLLLNSFPFNPSVFTKEPFLPACFCKSLLKGQEKKAIIRQVSLFQRKTVWRNICETPHVYSLLSWGRLSWGRIWLLHSARLHAPPPRPLHTNCRIPFEKTKSRALIASSTDFFTMEVAFNSAVILVTHSLV